MPLVNKKVKDGILKCETCAFRLTREKLRNKIDKNSVLYNEAEIAVDSIMKITCNMCPHKEDFEKFYGKKPYEYF